MKEELIFDILDGIASEEAIRLHEQYLANDEAYRLLFQELSFTHDLLEESTILEKTAVNFTDKLLDKWELAQQPATQLKPTLSQRLHIYFLWSMLVLLVLCLACMGITSSSGTAVIKVNMPALNTDIFQNKTVADSLLLLNTLLVLFFIDKKWLRPYFGQKLSTHERTTH